MKQDDPIEPWSRGKILTVFTVLVVLVSSLAVAFALTFVIGESKTTEAVATTTMGEKTSTASSNGKRRDQIAAKPMMQTGPEHWTPQAPTLTPADPMNLPTARKSGAAFIPSGFPRTPQGAVAQLAEITAAALQQMSVAESKTIFEEWSATGAAFEDWPLASAIAEFHATAGTVDGDMRISVFVQPVAGQIKGTDGSEWTLACVLLDLEVDVKQTVRFAMGHCERMEWVKGRWQIAAGKPPTRAPSTWPGSQYAVEAGWLPFEGRAHD